MFFTSGVYRFFHLKKGKRTGLVLKIEDFSPESPQGKWLVC